MKHPTDRNSLSARLVGLILAIYAIGSPVDVHGQTEIPVQEVENLGALTRLVLTLQLVFEPGALAQVNPLYAYNAAELAGMEIHPDRIGRVAVVHHCSPAADRTREGWCARYFNDVHRAFDAAYVAPGGEGRQDPDIYFATTYPLPNVAARRQFVSGLSH